MGKKTVEIEYPPEFTELFKTGRKLRQQYANPNNPNNKVIHVLTTVDDDHLVFKWWSKRKQEWVYQVEDLYFFLLLWQDGHLTAVGGDNE